MVVGSYYLVYVNPCLNIIVNYINSGITIKKYQNVYELLN